MTTVDVLEQRTLVDQLVERIYEWIVAGKIERGARITEEALANEFGVSRTPIREAVRRLAEMGVIDVLPRARMHVASFDAEQFAQICALREELEILALHWAAPRLTDEDLAHLDQQAKLCTRLLNRGSRLDVFRQDSRFHLELARLSGNPFLLDALRRLDVKVQLGRSFVCLSKAKIKQSLSYHGRIIAALRSRDMGAAERLLRDHIHANAENSADAGKAT